MTMALYMITIVIVKARGIIHIAFRVHALSNVIKMLATSGPARAVEGDGVCTGPSTPSLLSARDAEGLTKI